MWSHSQEVIMFFFNSCGVRPLFKFLSFGISIILFFIPASFTSYAQEQSTYSQETDNQEENSESVITVPFSVTQTITHCHTGGSGGGGCYGQLTTGSRTVEHPCGGSMIYYPATDSSGCDRCGAGYHGDESYRKCWHSTYNTEPYSYYSLNCGKNTTDALGSITLTKSTSEWTTSLALIASYENPSAIKLNEKPYIINSVATESDTMTITENGIYTLQLNIDENSANYTGSVSMDIQNIDTTPPQITEYILTPQEWTKNGVTFQVIQVEDLQSDGTLGSGLPEFPYSYDGGITWCGEDSYLYTKNGTYQVFVRDMLGNHSQIEFTIGQIDKEGPVITNLDYDHTQDISSTTLSVSANDILEDGREGIGLHEIPFSFDGGKTWTDEYEFLVTQNGDMVIAVRDKFDNITIKVIKITNIYEPKPHVEEEIEMQESIPDVTKAVEPIPEQPVVPAKKKSRAIEKKEITIEQKPIQKKTIVKKQEKLISEPSVNKVEQIEKKKFGVKEIIFLTSASFIGLLLLVLLLFFWYRSIRVYNEQEEKKFDLVGRLWIKKKGGHFEVVISSFIWTQCNTTHFKFKPSRIFLLFHKEEEIYFFFSQERCICMKAQKEMETVVNR